MFVAVYYSSTQSNEQFIAFMDKLQMICDLLPRERPYSIIMTDDFNCRSTQ